MNRLNSQRKGYFECRLRIKPGLLESRAADYFFIPPNESEEPIEQLLNNLSISHHNRGLSANRDSLQGRLLLFA